MRIQYHARSFYGTHYRSFDKDKVVDYINKWNGISLELIELKLQDNDGEVELPKKNIKRVRKSVEIEHSSGWATKNGLP